MDRYTHDFCKSVKASLISIIGRLDQLVGIANRPRENDAHAQSKEGAPTQEDYASVGKTFLDLHIPSPQQNTEKPQKAWYKTLDWWKKVLEIIAIPFAIAYAIVTYCQWRDIRHNFQVDERAWIKARTDEDIAGVYVNSVPVPWNGDTATFPLWTVRLTNIGKSVATDIHSDGILEILGNMQTPSMDFPLAHSQFSLKVLYPQEDTLFPVPVGQISSPVSLTKDEYDKLMSGDDYFVVFTETTYRDQFGPHWSRMCNASSGPFDKSKSRSFVHGVASKPCSDWNAVGDGQPLDHDSQN
jgi:hypothetical protein